MKIKKRITIVADILIDEDFDTNSLCICQMIDYGLDIPEIYVGCSSDFEVFDYISQEVVELGDESDENS